MRTWIMLAMWRNVPPRRVWAGIVGCLLFLSVPLAWSGATLEVFSPDSGHQWQTGTTASIQWNKGNAGKFLRLELHKAGKRYRIIKSSVRNTGVYRWRIPKSVRPGRYTVVIQSLDHRQVFAASDEFEITYRTTLREQPDENRPEINAPARGEILGQNRYLVEWDDVTDALGAQIEIQAYRGARRVAVLDDNAKNSGRYLWAAPARQLPSGRDYRIRLQSKADKDRFVLSESFTVGRPSSAQSGAYSLQVTLPSGKQRWSKGQTYVIRWRDPKRAAGPTVQIDLDRAGKYYQTIVGQTANTGRFRFTVPHQVINSDQYRVRVTSTTNQQISGLSAKNFAISGRSTGRLRVMTPTSGKEEWQAGRTQTIRWRKGAAGEAVRIDLYQSGRLYKILNRSTANDGMYQFRLAGTVAAGPDYAIRIQSTHPRKARVYDMSDRPFAIGNAQVPVMSGVCSTRCCRSLTPARHCGSSASLTQQPNAVTDQAGVAVSLSTQQSIRKPTVVSALQSVLNELPAESQAARKHLLAAMFGYAKGLYHSEAVSRLISRRTRNYLGRAIRSAERYKLVAHLGLASDAPDEAELRALSQILDKLRKSRAKINWKAVDLVKALPVASPDQASSRRSLRSNDRRWFYLARAIDRTVEERSRILLQVPSFAIPTSRQQHIPIPTVSVEELNEMSAGFIGELKKIIKAIPTIRIFRAQIEIETGDVSDAGTDDHIRVVLKGSESKTGTVIEDNFTFLDYGRDDFERGDVFTYDLDLTGLDQIKDINIIGFEKFGNDGWCIKGFRLIINNDDLLKKTYPECQWLDAKYSPGSIGSPWLEQHGISVSADDVVARFQLDAEEFKKLRTSDTWLGHGPIEPSLQLETGILPIAYLLHYAPQWRCVADELGSLGTVTVLKILQKKVDQQSATFSNFVQAGVTCFGEVKFAEMLGEIIINNKMDIKLTFPADELVSRIEGLIGHLNSELKETTKGFLFEQPLYWGEISGPAAVEVNGGPQGENEFKFVEVDLDLAFETGGCGPDKLWLNCNDPEVDVDFNVKLSCNEQGVVKAKISEVDVSVNAFYSIFTPGYDFQILPQPLFEVPECPDEINYSKNGDILVEFNDFEINNEED